MNDTLRNALKKLRLSGLHREPGRASARGRQPQPQPRRVPGAGPARRTGGALGPALAAPRQGRRLPRAEDPGRFRLVLQPVDQEEAGLRPGHVPLRPRDPRRLVAWDRRASGKSHLVQAIGYQAIKAGFVVLYRSIFDVVRDFLHDEALGVEDKVLAKYLKPDLLIIDDMGMKQLPKRSGEYLFEIVMRRYETRSTMMTSNRPLEDWGKLLGDVPAATAILDRFLHHAEIIQITGKSYRLHHQARAGQALEAESKPANGEAGAQDAKQATPAGR